MSEASVAVAAHIRSAPNPHSFINHKTTKSMKENNETVELPEAEKPTLYDKIKETLAIASQLIIAAPVKLPPKIVVVAKYVALALGVLEAVESAARKERRENDEDE
ncbi:hypothetical protein ACFOET_11680 [Parapedobacter deserti]|uniref:Uncharacterized protein n=1 Tax=Parapedobacter deserti TaxID=1912957 RepID=A0ABV7JJK8_9SPHI